MVMTSGVILLLYKDYKKGRTNELMLESTTM